MSFEDSSAIDANIELVWAIYSDVERWPEWTASVNHVDFIAGDTLALGARVRIDQPKLPTAEWEVTALDEGRSWTWVAKGPGVRTTASHILEPIGVRATRVHMRLEQRGPVGAILGRMYSSLTRRYLALETAGLKQQSEQRATA